MLLCFNMILCPPPWRTSFNGLWLIELMVLDVFDAFIGVRFIMAWLLVKLGRLIKLSYDNYNVGVLRLMFLSWKKLHFRFSMSAVGVRRPFLLCDSGRIICGVRMESPVMSIST